jgi:hypothetical protein
MIHLGRFHVLDEQRAEPDHGLGIADLSHPVEPMAGLLHIQIRRVPVISEHEAKVDHGVCLTGLGGLLIPVASLT